MPTAARRAKAKAKARVKRAAQAKRSNERRDTRFAAVRKLNTLAEEISLPGETLNVEGFCRAFKQRVQKLVDRDGDRITH